MSGFNSYHIKRQAHSVSRASDVPWNPFRHTYRGRSGDRRSDTWDGGRLEGQPLHRNDQDGGRLSHAISEPTRGSESLPKMGDLQRPFSTAETMDGHENAGRSGSRGSNNEPLQGEAEKQTTSRGVDQDNGGLRNRKQDDDGTRSGQVNSQNANETDDSNGKKKKEKQGLIRHVQPKEPFTFGNQLRRTLLNSWINILLLAAPVGIALNYAPGVNKVAVFVVNFIAIIPLAAMLSFGTEEIALRTGETLGGLLNATFGNAVELIVAILALIDGQVNIVKTSLIGSILSNLLLVMGCSFFLGGLRRPQQYFNETVAQTAASMLALAAASAIVPTVFDTVGGTSLNDVAKLSRGCSVILLLVYAAYLFFQLKTHQEVFNAESEKVPAKPWSSSSAGASGIKQSLVPDAAVRHGMPGEDANAELSRMLRSSMEEDDEGEDPQLHFLVAIGTLAISTIFIALCAEFMVESIHAVTASGGLSEEFVGLILLPIVGNAAEHATAVTVAIKDKMDLSLGVAIGSSMQVALFLIPLLVIIGWGMGNDEMNLDFDTFQVAVMFVAVLLTNYLIGDGKSHWLEGFLLICLYSIIAVCAFFYPNPEDQTGA